MHKDLAEILFTAEDLEARVTTMAAEITGDYAGKEPLFVSVLRGSFVFMADLVRKIELPLTVDFMMVSSYGAQTTSTGAVKILKDLDINVEGRDIIIVEDILDSGLTLSYIMNVIGAKKPRSVKLCTLLDKPERRRVDIHADYVGFTIPDQFIVGYGLDFAEKYRNLPYIGVLDPAVYA
ncbi:hypoxanthine phosphoribosyltransferase [Oscillospiraceae bacterium OttesenSCG-928-F05]|nr:hypoxanthine phosphoribosyltransferase [Oscillospiraceae bacterium OttesenSCG-928-F05]